MQYKNQFCHDYPLTFPQYDKRISISSVLLSHRLLANTDHNYNHVESSCTEMHGCDMCKAAQFRRTGSDTRMASSQSEL